LVRKTGKVSGSEALASLIVARLFDIFTVSIFFLVSAILIRDLPPFMSAATKTIVAFLTLLITTILIFIFTKEKFLAAVEKILALLKINTLPLVTYCMKKAKVIVAYMEILKSKSKMLSIFALSLLIWGSLYLLAFIILISLGVNLSFFKVIIGDTFLELSSILPIYTIGGFGVVEGAWSVAFISLGVSKQLAISSGFAYHLILLFYITLISAAPLINYIKKQLTIK
jgi:hypothetical protein